MANEANPNSAPELFDDALGLDDVEMFSEFLKFKKITLNRTKGLFGSPENDQFPDTPGVKTVPVAAIAPIEEITNVEPTKIEPSPNPPEIIDGNVPTPVPPPETSSEDVKNVEAPGPRPPFRANDGPRRSPFRDRDNYQDRDRGRRRYSRSPDRRRRRSRSYDRRDRRDSPRVRGRSGYVPGRYFDKGNYRSPHSSYKPSDWEGGASGPASWQTTKAPQPHVTPETLEMKLAVEKEAMQQKLAFSEQRQEYLRRRENLVEELMLLKDQRKDFHSNHTPDAQRVLAENLKLQDEIGIKIKSVDNVLDMLTGLVGDGFTLPPIKTMEKKTKSSRSRSVTSSNSSSSSSSGRSKTSKKSTKRSKSHKKKKDKKKGKKRSSADVSAEVPPRSASVQKQEQWNYIFYDPEQHWCRPCRIFPSTAKEYLTHLHSAEHRQVIQDLKLTELPWHEENTHKEPVVRDGWLSKRVPIKGLQFFVASPAWFCKLCRSWMGDLHCASLHLKSEDHVQRYSEFLDKNPTWETIWLSEREKAEISHERFQVSIQKKKLAEQIKLQQQAEEDMRKRLAAAELLIPLTLKTKPALKDDKKKATKGNKKKRRSSSSSTSSSSSSDRSRKRKKQSESRSKKEKELKVSVPARSKWEEEEEEKALSPRGWAASQSRNYRLANRDKRMKRPPSSPPPMVYEPPKVPEKHTILMPEVMIGRNLDSPPPTHSGYTQMKPVEDNEPESRFDKQALASAKRKASQPKTKFAFIGRMPFARRRPDETKDTVSKKEQDVATPDPTPPPPPVISKKVVIPTPTIPVLTNKTKLKIAKGILNQSQTKLQAFRNELKPIDPVLMESDLELRKPNSPSNIAMPPSPPKLRPSLPPEVTRNLGKKTMAVPLPKEFQDALSIIYPEEKEPSPPPLPKQPAPPISLPLPKLPPPLPKALPPSGVENGTPPMPPLPPPPPIVSAKTPPVPIVAIPAPSEIPSPPRLGTPPPPPPIEDLFSLKGKGFMFGDDEEDDMALLGIDKEDMAAQRF